MECQLQQVLWIETLVKLAGGLVLSLAPLTAIRVLGLSRTDSSFWPRLLGALLIGLAGAAFLEGRYPGSHGLGVGGAVIVNLAGAAMLATLLALKVAAPSTRGRMVLWTLVALLLILSLLEIAHI